jgi:uncharacterized protein YecE (DUF72 family)
MRCHVGTSGWQNAHWKGLFYPEDLPTARWLSFYAQHFGTVEINVTFYRDVRQATLDRWYNTVPATFLFALKMPRFITHMKKLRADQVSIDRFLYSAESLGDKLGVVLIQLPPALKLDEALMKDFFSRLHPNCKYAVEARNRTFIDDRFFSLLADHDIAWCIADTAGRFPYHETLTASFAYIRLHGSQALYASDYTDTELQGWRDKIRLWTRDTFVYFDNDAHGYAVKNGLTLKEILEP